MAGDAAAGLYANVEAIGHYTRALEAARRTGASNQQFIHLFTSKDRTLELCGQYDDAIANYQEMETVGTERDERSLELAALIPQVTIHATATAKFDQGQGRALSERARGLAQELHDHRAEAKVLWNLMLLGVLPGGDIRQAVAYGEQSLTIAREHNLREELAFARHDLSRAYWGTGKVEEARAAQREAGELWRELGNLPMLADNPSTIATGHYMVGEYNMALTLAKEGLEVSQSIGSLWGQAFSGLVAAPVYLELGDMDQAIKTLEDAITWGEESNFEGARIIGRAYLALTYGLLGELERGFELAQEALNKAEEFQELRPYVLATLSQLYVYGGNLAEANNAMDEALANYSTESLDPYTGALIALCEVEVVMASRDYDRVLMLTDRTITTMRSLGVHPFLADMLRLKGQALLQQGLMDEARGALGEARVEAEAVTSRRCLWPVLVSLRDIEIKSGNATEAESLAEQARNVIEYIADHISAPELRASFMSLPKVRDAMDYV